MLDVEFAPLCRRIATDLAAVTPDDDVLVVTEPENVTVARAVAAGARSVGADATLSVMPRLDAHGNEPPANVAAAMAAADVCVTATTHAVTHTRARIAAAEAGTRVVVMRGVTEDLMLEGGMNTDYDRLATVTGAYRDALAAADEARLTCPHGSDLWVELGRDAVALDGHFHDYGFSALPGGEAATSPTDAAGTVVVDHSMDNLGALDAPIEWTLDGARVVDIEGGSDAADLRHIVAEADENGNVLAEFALGTNPDARLVGNLAEDKKRLGTAHVAVGDNESLGGDEPSDIHLDGLVSRPTVTLDDTVVVDDGEAQVETVLATWGDGV
jgi:leucyl aminopeptidase (aminopeptidase T)